MKIKNKIIQAVQSAKTGIGLLVKYDRISQFLY